MQCRDRQSTDVSHSCTAREPKKGTQAWQEKNCYNQKQVYIVL